MVREGDIVVLAGSLPQGAPQDTYRVWTAACREKGARVCLDADGVLLAEGLKAAPYLIKPNEDELSRLIGHRLTDTDELIAEGRRLLKGGVTRVVISLGEHGALYLRGNEVLYAEGLSVPVGSTVGAGDSVVAALAYADSLGMSDEDAVRLSTATRRGERHVQRHAAGRTGSRRKAAAAGKNPPHLIVFIRHKKGRNCPVSGFSLLFCLFYGLIRMIVK